MYMNIDHIPAITGQISLIAFQSWTLQIQNIKIGNEWFNAIWIDALFIYVPFNINKGKGHIKNKGWSPLKLTLLIPLVFLSGREFDNSSYL